MEGTLKIYDGHVVYTDEVLDENFDEDVGIADLPALDETFNKPILMTIQELGERA